MRACAVDSVAAAEHEAAAHGVDNLKVEHFRVRLLPVDDIWIRLGESLLINRFRPVWNGYLDGFGNHDPGAGRYGGQRPLWDVILPGRAWATRCQRRPETPADIWQRVRDYWAANPPPASPHMRFMP